MGPQAAFHQTEQTLNIARPAAMRLGHHGIRVALKELGS
jgi:hypothetical protein